MLNEREVASYIFQKMQTTYTKQTNKLYLTRVTLNSEITDKPVALGFQIELEFGNVAFWGEGKTGEPGEKPLGARTRTNNKLNPHLTPSPGIEPGSHWWEACVGGKCSTTVPSLLHKRDTVLINTLLISKPGQVKHCSLSYEPKKSVKLAGSTISVHYTYTYTITLAWAGLCAKIVLI